MFHNSYKQKQYAVGGVSQVDHQEFGGMVAICHLGVLQRESMTPTGASIKNNLFPQRKGCWLLSKAGGVLSD